MDCIENNFFHQLFGKKKHARKKQQKQDLKDSGILSKYAASYCGKFTYFGARKTYKSMNS
jgi:hypothetical protein